MAHLQDIHPSIVKAICHVQAGIDAVKKDSKNQHGGYHFASTDSIYAAVTRRMADAGLVLLTLEAEPPKVERVEKDGKVSQWLRASYQFVLATAEATWTHAGLARTLYIQVTGPQTFQAAQSYAEKSFMRSLWKMPTGDMDLDSIAQSDDEFSQVSLNTRAHRKSSAEGKRDGSVKVFNSIRAEISQALNPEHLAHIREVHADEFATMPRAWALTLSEEYETKMDELRGRAA